MGWMDWLPRPPYIQRLRDRSIRSWPVWHLEGVELDKATQTDILRQMLKTEAAFAVKLNEMNSELQMLVAQVEALGRDIRAMRYDQPP